MDCNGRIDILCDNSMGRFQLHDKIPISDRDDYANNAMNGNWERSALSDTFFSMKNIQILQNGIRTGVYKESNGRFSISEQDEDILKIIMRSIFLQNSKNLPSNISEQVEELNNLVLAYAVPQVTGEAIGYVNYKRDASTMYTPIAAPASTYHSNTLEQKPWF